MNLETNEPMLSWVTPGSETRVFRKVYTAEDFSHISNVNGREAYAVSCNLALGLKELEGKLSADEITVLKNAMFSKFEELGVPSSLILPLLMVFGAIHRYKVPEEDFAPKRLDS